MRPRTTIRPSFGARMPDTVRSSVDLPAPLRPMTPRTEPFGTLNETSRNAGPRGPRGVPGGQRAQPPQAASPAGTDAVRRGHTVHLDRRPVAVLAPQT